jgi:hypothetical protein
MVTYFCSDHSIALMIVLKWGNVCILDSLDRDSKNYQDFLGILN